MSARLAEQFQVSPVTKIMMKFHFNFTSYINFLNNTDTYSKLFQYL